MEKSRLGWIWTLVLVILFCGMGREVYGQDKVRRYATRQHDFSVSLLGLGGAVTDGGKAVNGNLRESSTLSFVLGALGLTYAEQVVDFNPNPSATTASGSPIYSAGTPIFIKISLPKSLLGVLTGVEIQPITNLRNAGGLTGWTYNNVGSSYSGTSLLSLLSGAGESEFTLIPSGDYQGVRVKLSSALGVSGTCNFFHAYVKENSIAPLSCEEKNIAIDVLSGTRAGTAVGGIANATGNILNAYNAIDDNPNTFALINTGVQVLSEVFHTTVFNTPSSSYQVGKILLQDPGGGLLSLNLLTGFSIQPFLGSTPVGLAINSSSILNLKLLPNSANIYELKFPIQGSFDRIEIKMGGVASALSSLRVYEVDRALEAFIFPENELLDKLTACESVDLTKAIVNYDDVTYDYEFFSDPVVESAATKVAKLVSKSGTYYIRVVDGAGCKSEKVPVVANVLPLPGKPHITISDVIN